jgi:hypothetical protein
MISFGLNDGGGRFAANVEIPGCRSTGRRRKAGQIGLAKYLPMRYHADPSRL